MKRIIVLIAALMAFAGVSVVTAVSSSASVCQPDGTGCTAAGTYPGPDAVISSDYGGFSVVWTESVVRPYSSGVPLYWTAYVTYTNTSASSLTLYCPAPGSQQISENMSGGSGDDGMVYAQTSKCDQNPGLTVTVAPGHVSHPGQRITRLLGTARRGVGRHDGDAPIDIHGRHCLAAADRNEF